jgi:ABC-type molybdate transport system ATPase subunit
MVFGLATGDPANTGTTNLFTATNFPGSTTTVLSDAGALYALLTGRVSSINRSVILDEETRVYGKFQPIVRNQQRQIGLYFQDSWRLMQGLTVNYGLRWDKQNPPVNLNGVYTRPGYEGVWGISGVGNLFKTRNAHGAGPGF